MPERTLIEIVGYIGSALVLISFLMTSVVKLRLVNMAGGIISFVYSLIIGAYPLAFMNIALVLINLFFLWKIKHSKKDYRLVELEPDSKVLTYLLEEYQEDIAACFPGLKPEPKGADHCCLLLNEDTPAGLVLAKEENRDLHLLLDYSLPKFRDFSLGSFMAESFRERGYARLCYSGPDENHRKYLEKMHFQQDKDGIWIKQL